MTEKEFQLKVLRALMVQFVKEKTEYPKHDVFLCLAAIKAVNWEYRVVVRDLLEEDGIRLDGTGFQFPDDAEELVPDAVSANERRRIWLSNKIHELSA